MDPKLVRAYCIEMLGVFALVYFSAGAVCQNVTVTPLNQQPGATAMTPHHSGLLGVALVYGLMYGVLVTLTAPVSGGYLNPAITLLLWVANRVNTLRASWLIGAQFVGAVLAGLCLRLTFETDLLQFARYGAPHLNPLVYPPDAARASQYGGMAVELILTFFLVFAIFGLFAGASRSPLAGLPAGALVTAGVLLAFPITGAAFNPARWFGPVFWEAVDAKGGGASPWSDALVYLAGPILGALLGGGFCFRIYLPALREESPSMPDAATKPGHRPGKEAGDQAIQAARRG